MTTKGPIDSKPLNAQGHHERIAGGRRAARVGPAQVEAVGSQMSVRESLPAQRALRAGDPLDQRGRRPRIRQPIRENAPPPRQELAADHREPGSVEEDVAFPDKDHRLLAGRFEKLAGLSIELSQLLFWRALRTLVGRS